MMKAQMTALLLLILAGAPAYGAYKAVGVWDIMPESVVTWMSHTGLKAAYDGGGKWPEFRKLADKLVAQSDLSSERGLYLRLAIAQSGAPTPPYKFPVDSSELAKRVRFLHEAESLALLTPGDYHRALGVVFLELAGDCRMVGDWPGNLRAEKDLVERFYDVEFGVGAPKYWPTLSNTMAMPDFFADAGKSPAEAVEYLRGLAQQHPVREFRFAALLALGRQYGLMNDKQGLADVVRASDQDFADLESLPEFQMNLTGLRDVLQGKCHLQPAGSNPHR